MKSYVFAFFLLFTFIISKAQVNPTAKVTKYGGAAAVIVDSIEVGQNALSMIDPNNIERVDAIKGNAKYPNGAIYVTLKVHSALGTAPKLLSLQQITDEQVAAEDKSKTRIYLLDGRLITDTTSVRIDANRYHSAQVMSANDTPYFKTTMPNTIIIIISTHDPKGQLILRGTERD